MPLFQRLRVRWHWNYQIKWKRCFSIVNPIFKGKKNQDLSTLRSHSIHYGHIIDKETSKAIDEVLVMVMKAPNTYTKEDIIEINCHGGIVSVRKVLEQVLRMGARLAEPGEFTKRAFLNGRIDLSQAEAVIDIIEAKTDMSLSTAMDQLEGSLSHRIGELREELI